MNCPKCHDAMSAVEFGTDIEIMRCESCAGIFTKRDTLDLLRAEWLADTVLDIGANSTNLASQDPIEEVSCPSCHSLMELVCDEQQNHIVLDVCPACDGIFLDSGELTDIKTVTLMDHIRQLIKRLS